MVTPAIVDPAVSVIAVPVVEPAAQPVAEPPVTAPPTTLPPPPDTETRQQLAAAQAELADLRRRAATGELQAKAITYQRQLESDGWPPELAAINAKTWLAKEVAEAKVTEVEEYQETQAQREVARRLATRFGVSQDLLMGYSDPRSMYAAAERLGSESKRITALEAELAALKGGKVDPQRFDSGRGGVATSDEAFIQLYSEGKSTDHARARKLAGL